MQSTPCSTQLIPWHLRIFPSAVKTSMSWRLRQQHTDVLTNVFGHLLSNRAEHCHPSTITWLIGCALFFFLLSWRGDQHWYLFPLSHFSDFQTQSGWSYCSWSIASPSAIFRCSSHPAILYSLQLCDPGLCICNRWYFERNSTLTSRELHGCNRIFSSIFCQHPHLCQQISHGQCFNSQYQLQLFWDVFQEPCHKHQLHHCLKTTNPALPASCIFLALTSMYSPAHLTSFIFVKQRIPRPKKSLSTEVQSGQLKTVDPHPSPNMVGVHLPLNIRAESLLHHLFSVCNILTFDPAINQETSASSWRYHLDLWTDWKRSNCNAHGKQVGWQTII